MSTKVVKVKLESDIDAPSSNEVNHMLCAAAESKVATQRNTSSLSSDEEDSDDELGALIYQSSETAKARARNKADKRAAQVAYAVSVVEQTHTGRTNKKRAHFDNDGKKSARPKRTRARTQFYSPTKSEDEHKGSARPKRTRTKTQFYSPIKSEEEQNGSAKKRGEIGFGDVGYKFRKEFDEGWFTGTVTKIRPMAGE